MNQAKEICPTTAMNKVKQGALLVDVRTLSEVNSIRFDVPNFIHIPIEQLEARIDEIPKDQEIIMVCLSGDRSLRCTYFLMNAGYTNVYNLQDGIIQWATKGFPTKGDVNELFSTKSCGCSQSNCC